MLADGFTLPTTTTIPSACSSVVDVPDGTTLIFIVQSMFLASFVVVGAVVSCGLPQMDAVQAPSSHDERLPGQAAYNIPAISTLAIAVSCAASRYISLATLP